MPITSLPYTSTCDTDTDENDTLSLTAMGEAGVGAEVRHLLIEWVQGQRQRSTIDLDVLDNMTLRMTRCVQHCLFVLGELAMLGITSDEDCSLKLHRFVGGGKGKGKGSGEIMRCSFSSSGPLHFKLHLPGPMVDLIRVFMGNRLPHRASLSSSIALSSVTLSSSVDGQYSSSDGDSITRFCPAQIRAAAIVTVGKLCMRDKEVARDHVNILLREISQTVGDGSRLLSTDSSIFSDISLNDSSVDLSNTTTTTITTATTTTAAAAAAIRSNALLVLSDMCVRFTHLVGRHADKLSLCLQDPYITVRKNALVVLTQLMLQDYLKFRGLLLHRLVATVADPVADVATLARHLLKTLVRKFPGLLPAHFTEMVIVLNGCAAHPAFAAVKGGDGEGSSDESLMSSCSCMLDRNGRFTVYSFVIEGLELSDEDKIQLTAKLVQDILSTAVDNPSLLARDTTARDTSKGRPSKFQQQQQQQQQLSFENALADTFLLLGGSSASPLLRVGQQKRGGEDDALQEADLGDLMAGSEGGHEGGKASGKGGVAAVMIQAKCKILKKLSSHHMVEHLLPVIVSLKHCLEQWKSPLQGALMDCILSLMQSHQSEVQGVLQTDPVLKAEIEYDLKQHAIKREQQEKAEKEKQEEQRQREQQKQRSPTLFPQASVTSLAKSVKPVLRKSLGSCGTGATARTPFEALRQAGATPSSARKALSRDRDGVGCGGGGGGGGGEEEAIHGRRVDKTLFTEQEQRELSSTPSSSSCKRQNDGGSRRRSWGVVIGELLPAVDVVWEGEGGGEHANNCSQLSSHDDDDDNEALEQLVRRASLTPAKKRGRLQGSRDRGAADAGAGASDRKRGKTKGGPRTRTSRGRADVHGPLDFLSVLNIKGEDGEDGENEMPVKNAAARGSISNSTATATATTTAATTVTVSTTPAGKERRGKGREGRGRTNGTQQVNSLVFL